MTGQRHSGFTFWFTGLSGAGKTALPRSVHEVLRDWGILNVEILDGDAVRIYTFMRRGPDDRGEHGEGDAEVGGDGVDRMNILISFSTCAACDIDDNKIDKYDIVH